MGDRQTFEEWVNGISGGRAFSLQLWLNAIDGDAFTSTEPGVFTWGKQTLDLNGIYGSPGSTDARWAAFLYMIYRRRQRKAGLEPGPFEDLWAEDRALMEEEDSE